jgi:predicted nucleic acid-binding protein
MNVYLDTNIFLIFVEEKLSNCEIILRAAENSLFTPVISFHTFNEISKNLKSRNLKDLAGFLLFYIWSLPDIIVIQREQFRKYEKQYTDLVADIDDLPHIYAYFEGECDYFVTTNRRLTQMKIRESVNFKSPKEFVEKILGVEDFDTKNGI